jgi:hypothetical protein
MVIVLDPTEVGVSTEKSKALPRGTQGFTEEIVIGSGGTTEVLSFLRPLMRLPAVFMR